MSRTYAFTLGVVPRCGRPPAPFLDDLVSAISPLPDEVFAQNDRHDFYDKLEPALGPWQSLLHRKAAMCEGLRVLAGYESGWNWNEGRDTSAGAQKPEQQESGAFQVSADSMAFDASLPACVDRLAGAHDVATFRAAMQSNHALAVEYVARLLRFSTAWDGPINRGWVTEAVSRDACQEFLGFLS